MVGWGGDGKMGVERSGWRDGGGEMGWGDGGWGGGEVSSTDPVFEGQHFPLVSNSTTRSIYS